MCITLLLNLTTFPCSRHYHCFMDEDTGPHRCGHGVNWPLSGILPRTLALKKAGEVVC